jgi:hypothetical protein
MKYVTSSRRQVVMATLLALAIIGAAMRYWAPNPSLARDIGTLLLVLWLPAVGNLIAFLIRRVPRRPPPVTGFGLTQAFSPQLIVSLSPLPAAASLPDAIRCTVVIGNEGFTARTAAPLGQVLASAGGTQDVPIELLRPELALPRLPAGIEFQLFVGKLHVAHGTVERACP